jgi:prepilin-type N-terminal cleavage/methylation domain-containing protein
MKWALMIRKKSQGFSLIELMIVVAIITVLAMQAIPRFAKFQAKARQAEGQTNLSAIYTLQESFFAANGRYGAAFANIGLQAGGGANCPAGNDIGFSIRPCVAGKVNYTYSNTPGGGTAFTATAQTGAGANNRIMPGCAQADTWTINEARNLVATVNSVTACQ